MRTKPTICIDSTGVPSGSTTSEKNTGRPPTGKPPVRPPSPESARQLLAAAEDLAAVGGRAPDDLADTDLIRLLRGIAPAEAALDRAALMALGAARGRNLSWPRIGKALGLTADGARDKFDRACARHPDYTAPLAPTLGAHMSRAGDLIDHITDPPQGFTRHAAARLLGAVLLTATLEDAPGAAGLWLTDPDLGAVTAAAARHPKNDGAHTALTEFARERPGTRADLLDIIREAVQDSPWAVETAAPAALALEAGPAPADEAPHAPAAPALEDLRELARTWLRDGSDPAAEDALPGELSVAARRLGAVLLAATTEETNLDDAVAHVVPHWLDRDDTLAEALQALDARPLSHPEAGAAREALALHAEDEPPIRARLVSLMRAAVNSQHHGAVADVPSGDDTAAETDQDVDALVAIDGGVGVLNTAVDHNGGRVKPGRANPKTLRRLRNAGLVDTDDRVTDRGRAALPLATDRMRAQIRGAGYAPVRAGLEHAPAAQKRDTTSSLRVQRFIDAGLSPDFAAALHEPLLNLEVSGELMYKDFIPEDLRQGPLVGVLRAIQPALMGRDAGRLRLLLRTLPELSRGQGSLDLGRLEPAALGPLGGAYLQVLAVLEEYSAELTAPCPVPEVVSAAGLPVQLGDLLHLFVPLARVPAVASWAPRVTSVAGPALTELITAVDDGQAHALSEALEAVAALAELDVPAEQPHQLVAGWESLVYAWRHRAPTSEAQAADLTGSAAANGETP